MEETTKEQLQEELAEMRQTIAKLYESEAKYRQMEEHYRVLFERASDAIVLIDAETGALVAFNEMAYKNLGYTREEFETLKIADVESIESADEVARHIEKILKEGFDTFETKYKTKRGEIRHIQVNSRAISLDGRNYVQSIWRDITARKQAETALRESAERYRLVSELTSDYTYSLRVEPDGAILMEWITEAFTRITGYTLEDFKTPGNWSRLYYPDDMPIVALRRKVVLSGQPYVTEFRIVTRLGQIRWVRDYSRSVWDDSQGRVVRIVGAGQDITARKRAEEALRENATTMEALMNASVDFIALIDTKGIILNMNAAMAQIFGRSKDELIGRYGWDLLSPDIRKRRKAYFDQVIQSGKPCRFEDIRQGIWFDNVFYPVFDAQGKVIKIILLARDISDHKQTQQYLQEAKTLFEKIFTTQLDAILVLDAQSPPIIKDCNPATTEIFGYTRQELVGRDTTFLHIDEAALHKFQDLLYPAIQEQGYLHLQEFRMRRKDGTIFPTEHSVLPLEDDQGARIGWLSVVRDISERKRLEEQVRQAQKMDLMGHAATGIAHELRNPLSGINILLGTLKERLEDQEGVDEEIWELIVQAQAASHKMESVIKRVLDFVRPTGIQRTIGDINGPIEEAIKLFAVSSRKAGITIETVLARDLAQVAIDRQSFEQVILNLLINAADVLEQWQGPKKIAIISERQGDYVCIRVGDSGPGIPPDQRTKIFEPFYTTKSQGSGIGLSLCHKIIMAHEGSIKVSTSDLGGAEFIIQIPI
jgi:PAS domain S-box-containing protein